jgi:DNA-binding transcriptional LysR family regulator
VFSFEALALMVGAGLGLAVAPEGALRGRVAALGLTLVPLGEAWARRRHVIVARRFAPLPPPAQAFVAYLEDCGQSLRRPRRKAAPSGK